MIPVRSEHIYSIQSALKCARRELKLYIFTEVSYMMSHLSVCVKMLRSANPRMNVTK